MRIVREISKQESYLCVEVDIVDLDTLDDRENIIGLILNAVGAKCPVGYYFTSSIKVGLGMFTYTEKSTNECITRYFKIDYKFKRTYITIDDKPCWRGSCSHDKPVRRRLVDKMIQENKGRILSIGEILGVSLEVVKDDLRYISKWNRFRKEMIKILANNGILTSTEICDILNIDAEYIISTTTKLRKRKEIPPGKKSKSSCELAK